MKRPPERKRSPIIVGIPTHGWVDVDFFMNVWTMARPIHTNLTLSITSKLAVGPARDEIVQTALRDGATHVFFRDHDVLAPPNALGILLQRKAAIIGGLYYSKQRPPWPLIFRDGHPVTDWHRGDVVRCEGIGMGCTLVSTDVFRQLDPPWFMTVSEGGRRKRMRYSCTEDTYFCNRAIAELGIYPYCDTGVSCIHYDLDSRARYYYSSEVQGGVCHEQGSDARGIAAVGSPLCKVVDLTQEAEDDREYNTTTQVGTCTTTPEPAEPDGAGEEVRD